MPFICCGVSCVSSMLSLSTKPRPSQLKKFIYNPLCDEDEESISYMLNEELDTDSDDKMNLERRNCEWKIEMKCWKVKVKQVVLCTDGWKTWQRVTRNPRNTHKNARSQFNLLPDAEFKDYFILLFRDKLLNNTVIDKQVCKTQNCQTSATPVVHLE
jgi:hypothetical protein